MSGGRRSDSNARRVASPYAFGIFLKSLFGAGLLTLPNALGRVGLVLGSAIYALVAVGCAVTCYVLLRARDVAHERILGGGPDRGARIVEAGDGGAAAAGEGGGGGLRRPAGVHPAGEAFPHPAGRRRAPPPPARAHHLVTYGDLADVVLGPRMASLTRWTIITLNFLFTVGLVIVVCENMSSVLGWDDRSEARRAVGWALLPVVAALLQIPWLQDLCGVSALGLLVYCAGVVGSTLYGAARTIGGAGAGDSDGDGGGGGAGGGMPEDMWEVRWSGAVSFAGSAVYAMEGINLALPTLHSMRDPSDAVPVVCGSILLYGLITIVFAAVGYAGGLGGGPGTGREYGECDVVTTCMSPPALQTTVQVALSVSMVLSIPVMLYPSTEMLEVMLTDRREAREDGKPRLTPEVSMVEYRGGGGAGESQRLGGRTSQAADGSPYGTASVYHRDAFLDDDGDEPPPHTDSPPAPHEFSQDKSWSLRLLLSALVVFLGASTPSFTLFSSVVGAVGLTFAGFVLPPLIYARAAERAGMEVGWPMRVCLAALVGFGMCNMAVGGITSIAELVRAL